MQPSFCRSSRPTMISLEMAGEMIAFVLVVRPFVVMVIVVEPLTGTVSPQTLTYLVLGAGLSGFILCAFARSLESTVVADPVSGKAANVNCPLGWLTLIRKRFHTSLSECESSVSSC